MFIYFFLNLKEFLIEGLLKLHGHILCTIQVHATTFLCIAQFDQVLPILEKGPISICIKKGEREEE